MKTAANCESQCKMHYLLNRSSTRRTHMAAHYVGHACPRVGYTSARARTVSTERRRAAVSRWRTNPPPRRTACRRSSAVERYEGFSPATAFPRGSRRPFREPPRAVASPRGPDPSDPRAARSSPAPARGSARLRHPLPVRDGQSIRRRLFPTRPPVGPHSVSKSIASPCQPGGASRWGPSASHRSSMPSRRERRRSPPSTTRRGRTSGSSSEGRAQRGAPVPGRTSDPGRRCAPRDPHTSDLGSGEITR